MKLLLTMAFLLLTMATFGQSEQWKLKIDIEKADLSERDNSKLQTPFLLLMCVSLVASLRFKKKADKYYAIIKKGAGGVEYEHKKVNGYRNSFVMLLSGVVAYCFWLGADGPVFVIHFIKPFIV